MPTSTNAKYSKILDIKVDADKAIQQLGRLRATMEDVRSAQTKLKDELDQNKVSQAEYNRQMAALDNRMRSLKDQTRVLTKEVQNTIKADKAASGSLNELRARLSNLTREFDNMSRSSRMGAAGINKMMEINKVTNEIKNAEKATQRFYRNVGNYTSALKGIKEMTSGFRQLGSVIAMAMGGFNASKFLTDMVATAREFEDALARVRAVSNPTITELESLRDTARELGRTTKYTAGEVAQGMELLARNGLSAEESIRAINPTLQLAQANTISMADAAQISTNVMHAFGKTTYELALINDVLSSSCAHSATNITELGEAMKTAAPVAKVAGITLEETSAALGAMANVGVRGSEAGTGIKMMLLALSKAYTTKKGKEILDKYNLTIDQTTIKTKGLIETLKDIKKSGLGESSVDVTTLVGRYAAPRVMALVDSVDQMDALNNTLEHALGENQRMFEQSLGNTTSAVTQLKSTWESFQLDVYESTSEYIVKPITGITDALRFLGKEIDAVGQLATSLIGAFTFQPLLVGFLKPLSAAYSESIVALEQHNVRRSEMLAEAEERYKISSERQVQIQQELDARILALDEATANRRSLVWDRMNAVYARDSAFISHLYAEASASEIAEIQRVAQVRSDLESLRIEAVALANDREIMGVTEMSARELQIRSEMLSKELDLEKFFADERIAARRTEFEKANADVVENANQRVLAEEETAAKIKKINEEIAIARKELQETTNAVIIAENDKLLIESTAQVGKFRMALRSARTAIVAGVKAVAGAIKAVMATVLPLLALTVVFEAIQGFKRMYEIAEETRNAVENAKKAADDAVRNNKTITQLENIKTRLDQINSMRKKGTKEIKEQEELTNQAKGLLGDQIKQYGTLQEALAGVVKNMSEQVRLQTLLNLYQQRYQNIVNTGSDNGLTETDPAVIEKKLREEFNSMNFLYRYYNTLGGFFGMNTLSRNVDEVQRDLAGLRAIEKELGMTQEQILAMGDGNQAYKVKPTGSGDFQKTDSYKPKDKKGDSIYQQFLKKYAEYRDKFRQTVADNQGETLVGELDTIQANYEKTIDEIEVLMDTNGKNNIWNRFKNSKEITPEQLKKFENLLGKLKEQTAIAKYRQDMLARQKFAEQQLSQEKEVWDMRVETEQAGSEELYKAQMESLKKQNRLAQEEVLTNYYKGTYGNIKGKAVTDAGKEYKDKKNEIDESFRKGEITDERYNALMSNLDMEYQAYVEYYTRLHLLMTKSEQSETALKKKQLEEQYNNQITAMQNQYNQMLMAYEQQINARYGYYKDLEIGSQEYWDNVKSRIGTELAIQFQMQYAEAQQELDLLLSTGKSKEESQEAYDAKVIAARQKMVDVHTQTNEAITQSDEARWQAAESVMGGLVQLTEEIAGEDKEAAKLAKVLALAQIAINTGEAIAKMVSAEANKGVIGIPTMAAGIATILANVASAISTVKAAHFATGGKVIGAGTGTSDSIPAMLSNGEYVMTARATNIFEPVLMAMNQIGAGISLPQTGYVTNNPNQMNSFKETMVSAMAEVRPVVSVQEITRTQNRVKVVQNLDSY